MRCGNFRKVLLVLLLFLNTPVISVEPKNSFIKNSSELEELKTLEEKSKKEVIKNKRELTIQELSHVKLKAEINKLESQITLHNISVHKLKAENKKSENNILILRAQIDESINVLKESLTTLHKAENPSIVEIFVNSKSFNDFIDKTEIAKYISKKITDTVSKIDKDIEKIEKLQNENQKRQQEIKRQNEELLNKKLELKKLYAEVETTIKHVRKELDDNSAQLKEIANEIQEYLKKAKGSPAENEKKVSKFVWPVPGYKYISSGYNDTVGRRSVHHAIDIAGLGIFGAKVRACADGTVVYVNNFGYGRGYGIYVILYHGNEIFTLYAHLSGAVVKVGTKVSQNQLIGFVGNSGHSTGPHLHWEARKGDTKFNPLTMLN